MHELDGEQGLIATAFTTEVDEMVELAEVAPRQRNERWFHETLALITKSQNPDTLSKPKALETVLPNGVTVYGLEGTLEVQQLADVVNSYPEIFQDSGGFVNIDQSEWMKIPLLDNWQEMIPKRQARVYPQGNDAKEVIDRTFNGLHETGRMSWSTKGTPFSWPVFVVWKTAKQKRIGRAVVDMRGLNHLALRDAYPIPLQSDILSAVHGCSYITVIDCASFFYQWKVALEDRHKLTVVTHRGQEQFNVAVMGFKNSVSYVQRQIDRILRPFRDFSRAYVDDVVIFSKTLKEHITHLHQVFQCFLEIGISIGPSKAFIGFPSIKLLGQYIDSFGLVTAEDKIKAISQLEYPDTLQNLEHYLGLTGWLRGYVPFYATKAEPLQLLKTSLLRKSPVEGAPRRAYTLRTRLEKPTIAEQASFDAIQDSFSKPTCLFHHNPAHQLYLDVDTSLGGIGVMVYHVKDDLVFPPGKYPSRNDVEPVLFLSRLLNTAEKNYWPTELEVAGLVWAVRKVRHMIESSKSPVRVFTDHGAITGIVRQRSLETESTDRANLLLVRASNYLQQFNLDVHHKPGTMHVVPDALSRLKSPTEPPLYPELDFADVNYAATIGQISDDFKKQIQEAYATDKKCPQLIQQIKENDKLAENKAELPFAMKDGLLWHHVLPIPSIPCCAFITSSVMTRSTPCCSSKSIINSFPFPEFPAAAFTTSSVMTTSAPCCLSRSAIYTVRQLASCWIRGVWALLSGVG
jgi:hypothetical protein